MAAEEASCYFFAPGVSTSNNQGLERRQDDDESSSPSAKPSLSTAQLLKGFETQQCLALRFDLYDESWRPKETSLKEIVSDASQTISGTTVNFIAQYDISKTIEALPVAILVSEPGNALPNGFFDSALQKLRENGSDQNLSLELSVSQGLTTKGVLKFLNDRVADLPSAANASKTQQSNRHLNYDLEGLHSGVTNFKIRRVILLFHEAEAFDSTLLLDLIQLFNVWKDRIPFVLLFGISTSADLFQAKLPNRVIRSIESRVIQIASVESEKLFMALHKDSFGSIPSNVDNAGASSQVTLWLGPNISKRISDRQRDILQRPSAVINIFKYIYMSHFFANPLTIGLNKSGNNGFYSSAHLQAIRCLPSFKRYCEGQLDTGEVDVVERLLDDDEYLKTSFEHGLKSCSEILHRNTSIVSLLFSMQVKLHKEHILWSEIYQLTMAGQLLASRFVEDFFSSLRRIQSGALTELLGGMVQEGGIHLLSPSVRTTRDVLLEYLSTEESHSLKSGHDLQQQSHRTTIVAQKVELSQHTATLTKAEVTYTGLLDEFHDAFKDYLSQNIVDPQSQFPIEVLMYDLPSPYRDVVNPQSSSAIERGLARPHYYMGSDCCKKDDDMIAPGQPVLSSLYKMYLESGELLNVADLWSAFSHLLKGASGQDAGDPEIIALFESRLAELKYLGMVKQSKRKFDHVAKLSWNGL